MVAADLSVGGSWQHWSWQRYRHRKQVLRINGYVQSALRPLGAGASPALELHGEKRARAELLMASGTALMNRLWSPQGCSPEKIRAISEGLDKTNGAELQTVEGCLRLMAQLEEACPDVKDYAWFVNVREMQDEGVIPRLAK